MADHEEGSAVLAPTGIESLDALLRGGLPAASTTMLLGSPGIGKTLLGLQFLDAGARAKEPCLYFGFQEPAARIIRKAKSIGVDLAAHVKQGTLELQWHAPQEPLADRLAEILFRSIVERKARRVFIDGFAGFSAGLIYSDRVQPFAISLANELRRLGVTAVFSEEIAGVFGPELVIPPGAAAVADNVLFLRHVELRSQIRRLISVLKMGDHGYEASLREFTITDRGLEVASTFETAEAILTGVARPLAPSPSSSPRSSTRRKSPAKRARR